MRLLINGAEIILSTEDKEIVRIKKGVVYFKDGAWANPKTGEYHDPLGEIVSVTPNIEKKSAKK